MTLKELLTEERAVSPVIGVILMVAITVILAAVIGTFVIGLGDGVGDTAPQASFDFEQNDTAEDPTNVTFTHTSGDSIPEGDYEVVASDGNITATTSPGELTAGSSVESTLDFEGASEATVRLVYDDGERSTTLATGTAVNESG